MRKIYTHEYTSPCGTLLLGSFGDRLCLCDWLQNAKLEANKRRIARRLHADYAPSVTAVTQQAARELDEYFSGERQSFSIPLMPVGTDFQQLVWHSLLGIGYGRTITYGNQASMIGREKAVRAVAAADGMNAIAIFLPCHRIVGASGSLTGYAGGLDAKRYLLDLESGRLVIASP